MKVALHVGQLNQAIPGGIGTYIRELLTEIPKQGIEVETFCAGPTPRDVDKTRHMHLSGPSGGFRYEIWHRLKHPVVKIDTDVIHAPSLAIPPVKKPLVVSVHDASFLKYPEMFTTHGVRFHERGLNIVREKANGIIVPSQSTRQALVEYGIPTTRIHVVPYGVTIGKLSEDSSVIQRNYRLDTPFVLAVGTIEPRKGFDFLADVMRDVQVKIGNIPLVIAGRRGWGNVSQLDQNFVRELGEVSPDVLEVLYRTATIVAVPSRYEGFGFPALEAMARGATVVASNASSLPEVVGEGGVLVDPNDHDAWVKHICELLESPMKRSEISERALQQASGFSWEKSAVCHAEVYKAVVQ